MTINRNFFFKQIRKTLFGAIKQSQVDGLNAIIDVWEQKYSAWDDRWLAYALATAHHETDMKMQPIKEYGNDAYLMNNYDRSGKNPKRAIANGNTKVGDGRDYCGRGYVQLTWKNNYLRAGNNLGVDLVGNPSLALDPNVAAKILFVGMNEGWFTGKKFKDYFNSSTEGWVSARRIINGQDKAQNIAEYGQHYYAALSHTV